MRRPPSIAREISYASSASTRAGRAVIRSVENLTGRLRLIRMARDHDREVAAGRDFWAVMVERYGLSLDVVAGSLDEVPPEGPLVVIANHPYGILDGLMLGHILSSTRGDFRILAHQVFRKAAELDRVILPVNFDETRQAQAQNIETRRVALDYLARGGAIGVFPGGAVATAPRPFGRPMDPGWRRFTARMIAKSGATVLPVFFEAMWNFIRRNSRAAGQLVADIEAQVASARLGAKRFVELIEKYGEATVFGAANQLMDYSERLMRQRIAEIPDGDYVAEGWLDDDGRNRDQRLKVKVTVRVKGDGVEVDLTGSADQTPTAYNVPFEGSTKVAAYCAFRKLLLDAVTSDVRAPSNEGSFRPVTVTAPLGSIFNPRAPASAEARFTQCNRMIDLILKALAPVMPEQVIAGSSASISFAAYSGVRPSGDYWVFLEVNEGAYGGRPRSDGPDSIDNLMANTRNNPLEDLAMHLPMICDRYELRDDVPPGAGEFRGGIGVVKAQRVLTPAFITHESERHTDAPWGAFGGGDGAVGKCLVSNRDRPGEVREMHSKFSGLAVEANDVMAYYSPNGGGYGSPLKRPARKVLEDVLDGFYSVEHAREAYGVVVDLKTETVDVAATEALRARMSA